MSISFSFTLLWHKSSAGCKNLIPGSIRKQNTHISHSRVPILLRAVTLRLDFNKNHSEPYQLLWLWRWLLLLLLLWLWLPLRLLLQQLLWLWLSRWLLQLLLLLLPPPPPPPPPPQ